MADRPHQRWSRRERQIMEIVYETGSATASEIQERLPDPPGYSAVRALLRILEEKGHLTHRQDGQRYVYAPTIPRDRARRSALKHLVDTFFEGSAEKTVATLLSSARLSGDDLDRLAKLIEHARREGR